MSLLMVAAIALSAQPAGAHADPASGVETYVPYAASDGVVEWKADGSRGVYLRSLAGGWYYARTANRCSRLRTATRLGFITPGSDDLDRFGTLVAEGWRCPLESVTRSAPPPGEHEG